MITNVLKTLGSLRATLVAAAGIPFLIAASAFAQNDLSSSSDLLLVARPPGNALSSPGHTSPPPRQ